MGWFKKKIELTINIDDKPITMLVPCRSLLTGEQIKQIINAVDESSIVKKIKHELKKSQHELFLNKKKSDFYMMQHLQVTKRLEYLENNQKE